ncbi:protein FAR-RED IMPAIRED RESPONSE 1-like [Silene latifolia]|uniref:protein FAR-RED IMPAIRED RESPONSE 1-like n=1 Tax=Silene latifolia TaxID=37657 RepID=UPI003D785C33
MAQAHSCKPHEKAQVVSCDLHELAQENFEDSGEEDVDYSDMFVFEHPFKTFEEAFGRCDEVAYGLGFHLVKAKYHMEKSPPYKIVKCERYGPYNSKAKDPEKPQRKSKTKKFMCPFVVRVIKRGEGVCIVVPKCGVHNHKFGKFLEGHRCRAKFTEEQKELIKQYRQSHVKPGMVRHAFTLRYPDQPPPILKQMYNENARLSAKDRDGRNSVQYMLHLANEANYLSESIKNPLTKKLTHVWFTHPEAVQMFKAWPNIILIDSTYKINMYGLILVQCVGVTPVGKSFLIGCALIENEGTDGYKWVLRRLESLLELGVRPTVIVTDHERGLIAALPAVFRTSHHFLCLFHVYTAIEARATNMERNGNFGKALALGAWKKVVEAKTFDECNMDWNELRKNIVVILHLSFIFS